MPKDKLWMTFRKPEELVLETTLKGQSLDLTANMNIYGELGSKYSHLDVGVFTFGLIWKQHF